MRLYGRDGRRAERKSLILAQRAGVIANARLSLAANHNTLTSKMNVRRTRLRRSC
jgi:hypothetical protein